VVSGVERAHQLFDPDPLTGYEYAAVATHRVCERSRPAILVHDHHRGAPRLECVLVLPHEEDVEHADDPAIDQIDEHRNSFARHRSICRIRDHHDVDGAKFVFVRFDPCLQGVGVDQVR